MMWTYILLIVLVSCPLVNADLSTLNRDCHSIYDAVLVVDGSESIGLENFKTIKRALMEFVNNTLQTNKDVHLGVVLYSSGVEETVNMTSDWAMLDDKINAMAWPARATFTDSGIEAATAMLLEQGRKVVPRILIVVTDGLSTRPDRTLVAAAAAKQSSITVYSVGIEVYVKANTEILARYKTELSTIASDEGHVIHLADFNEFENIAPELATKFCAVVADVVTGLQNLTVYVGDTFTLTAEMSHAAVVGGTWTLNGAPLSDGGRVNISNNGSLQHLTLNGAALTDAGEYAFTVGTTTAQGYVRVDATTITQGLTDQTVSQGTQVVFQVTLSQTGITGDWFKDGVSLTGDSRYQTQSSGNTHYMYFNSQVSDSGRYMFTANGQSTSAQLTVTGSGAVNGNWGEWTQWSGPTCPATCGSAAINNLSRSRSCDNPTPSNGGTSCTGEASQSESRNCGPSTCDSTITGGLTDQTVSQGTQVVFQVTLSQTGITGDWFKDGVSITGDSRYQTQSSGNTQYMFFANSQVSDSGTYMFTANGQSTSAQLTVTGSGAVNGNWGEWTQWSGPTCPATCGSAAINNLSRSRSCDNPAPSNGGTSCTGEASQSESRMCGPSTCDTTTITQGLTDQTVSQGTQVVFQVTLRQTGITGGWFKDGVSITGDSRYQTQSSGNIHYMYFNSQVSDSGTYMFTANGQSTSAQLTVTGSGAVNGNWGEWTQWSGPTCPATCGSAAINNLSRSRSCDNPAPSNGGTSCTGEASQSESRMCGPSTCDATTITQGLTDQTVSQGTQVVFQVTLRQTGITGGWFKDGVSITGDSRYQTQSSGNIHYMYFNSQVSDSGTYMFTANGQSTSAQLTVTGSGAVNGNWGEWTQWSGPTCPATCGSAAINNLSRSRSCDNPAPSNGGTSCTGEASQSESRMCGPSTCDATTITQGLTDQTVSQGTQVVFQVTLRQTGITGGWFKDGVSITGDSRYQTQSSGNIHYMYFNSQVSDSGTYMFTANGQSTSAQLTVTGSGAVNGNWGEWTQWSGPTCPATCGSAAINNLSRSRSCDNPAPSNGGTSCTGEASQSESRMCGPSTCDTTTITQGLTDQTVSQGTQVVFQVTLRQTGITGGWFKDGVSITGDSRYQTQSSGNIHYMYFNSQVSDSGRYMFTANGQSTSAQLTVTGSGAVNGNWGEWTQWSGPTCPATCGSAAINNLSRSRSCDNPAPSNGGTSCTGEASQSESRMCGPSTCDTTTITGGLTDQTVSQGTQVVFQVTLSQTGITGDWFKDGVSITGDSRYQTQSSGNTHYMYFNSQVSDSGRYMFTASGQSTSAQLTVTGSGAVNGNWGEWTQWSGPTCPATCGSAAINNLSRSRSCDNPAPSNGGTSCTGEASQSESRMCGPSTCDTTTFTQGLTDQTISQGTQVVFQVTLSQGGVTGEWFKDGVNITGESRYQSYQTGNSIYLLFANSQVSDSGRYTFTVNGQSTSAQLTVTGSGAVNGNWGGWSQWSGPTCPATCGSAARHTVTRRRFCNNPAPTNGGTSCPEEASQSESRMCGPSTCDIGFTTELRDTRARLGGDFTLTAVVNRTGLGDGQWTKGGQALTTNDRMTIGSDGTGTYTLRVRGTETIDEGRYTFSVGGKSTGCRVTVVDCHSIYDAVLVVDGSESIGLENFKTIKRALMEFVNNTLQPNQDVHLGVVLYSSGVVETVNMTSDWAMLDDKINAMAWPARATFTDSGIEAATAMLLEQGRKVVPRILIVVTDGLSSRPDRTLVAAAAAKQSSITVYSVGIEVYVKANSVILARYKTELSTIASDEGHVIHLADFNEFENIAPELATKFCAVVADVVTGPQNLTVYVGDTFTLIAQMSHAAVVGGTWTLNGVPLSDGGRVIFSQNGSLLYLTIQEVTAADAGRYSYRVGGKTAHGYVTVLASWGPWGDWASSPCTATCGLSVTQTWRRTRQCRQATGPTCVGDATDEDVRACSVTNCYGMWSDWGKWSTPSCPICGQSGTQVQVYRIRTCIKERATDEACPGSSSVSSGYACTLNQCTGNQNPSASDRVRGTFLVIAAGVAVGLTLL